MNKKEMHTKLLKIKKCLSEQYSNITELYNEEKKKNSHSNLLFTLMEAAGETASTVGTIDICLLNLQREK